MACVLGGLTYWFVDYLGANVEITVMASFLVTCAIRLLAVVYHIQLPVLKSEDFPTPDNDSQEDK